MTELIKVQNSLQQNGAESIDRNPPKLSLAEVQSIAQNKFGFGGEFTPLESERDQNFLISTDGGEKYVLKISNADENFGSIDFQTQALIHAKQQDPELCIPRVIQSLDGKSVEFITTEADGTEHMVHMLSYLPGTILSTVKPSSKALYDLGKSMARLNKALCGFFHPSAQNSHVWELATCDRLLPYTHYIKNEKARSQIQSILKNASENVLPKLNSLRHQVVHQDAHKPNILLDSNNLDKIAGLIDFGDMMYAPLVVEVAITVDLLRIESNDPIAYAAEIVRGYDDELPLEEEEIDLIYDLILARFAAKATIIAQRNVISPDEAWLIDDEKECWDLLEQLESIGRNEACSKLRAACNFPSYCPAKTDVQTNSDYDYDNITKPLIERRKKVLGKNVYTFYQKPLHVTRGEGLWLIDNEGERYLDAYNNVPIAGHCHPRIVKATSRQIKALNTNSRYVYDIIVNYSERLLRTMPSKLDVCLFVNSGSEANDVAWQMAKLISGNNGALVMHEGYHGITDSLEGLSPQYTKTEQPEYVEYLMVPDPYRGKYRYEDNDYAEKYIADCDRAIDELTSKGYKPAAWMVDTSMLSNGAPDIPKGYVSSVTDKVRATGGLLIADEVQAGFGRLGSHMWGFQSHNVIPDIVSIGKPIGNGYPLGVVVTTSEILDKFREHTGFFSTFAGNPAGCAAAMAVLQVIEDENLMDNAKVTGQYLRDRIRSLMSKHQLIGDVRGHGMIAGVELVRDRETLEPATEETKRLIELLRHNKVLIAKEGSYGNILKIRPSLVFQKEHVDILVSALDKSLSELKNLLVSGIEQ